MNRLGQNDRMPVTEQNSTVKIAFLNEKILQKNSVFYCTNCQKPSVKIGYYSLKS